MCFERFKVNLLSPSNNTLDFPIFISKSLADRPFLPTDCRKKVERAQGTKRESALKNLHEGMAFHTIEVDTFNVSKVSSDEWPADLGASQRICNDICVSWNVRQLEVPIIVR